MKKKVDDNMDELRNTFLIIRDRLDHIDALMDTKGII